jgi:hypothetical protein
MFFSCAPTLRYISLDGIKRKPNDKEIQMYSSVTMVPFKYKEIGLISIQSDEAIDDKVFSLAKNKAREVGADAIILINEETKNDGYFVYGHDNAHNAIPWEKHICKFSALTKIKE